MLENFKKEPMTMRQILGGSISFIFKNILWITLFGVLISIPGMLIALMSENFDDHAVLIMIIQSILLPILAGMVTIMLGEHFCGNSLSLYQGFKKTMAKMLPIMLLFIVNSFAIILGFILFIIPGVIVVCATACLLPAMCFEDLKIRAAYSRSLNLTKKNRFRIFGYLVASIMIMFFIIFIISFISGISLLITTGVVDHPILSIGVESVIYAYVQAFFAAITTLLYFDLRIRKEAKDPEEKTIVPNFEPKTA